MPPAGAPRVGTAHSGTPAIDVCSTAMCPDRSRCRSCPRRGRPALGQHTAERPPSTSAPRRCALIEAAAARAPGGCAPRWRGLGGGAPPCARGAGSKCPPRGGCARAASAGTSSPRAPAGHARRGGAMVGTPTRRPNRSGSLAAARAGTRSRHSGTEARHTVPLLLPFFKACRVVSA